MVIFSIIIVILLIILAAMEPIGLNLSIFEIKRRQQNSTLSSLDHKRYLYNDNIITLIRLITTLILIIFVPISMHAFGWLIGVLVSVIVALEYQTFATFSLIRAISRKIYRLIEKYLFIFCQKAGWFFKLFRSSEQYLHGQNRHIQLFSKEELVDALQNSGNFLSKNEKILINSALKFEEIIVKDIMTPRSLIDSINQQELLGPVILSDLHKTGHSRFPVVDGDIDHVVGMLYVRNLLTIDTTKNSQKVSNVMDPEICFIHEDQTLKKALASFLKTKKLLFIVINEFRETVGLLSLEDVLEALLGQKINDEFEKHSDLRAVAESNPRKNNSSDKSRDV